MYGTIIFGTYTELAEFLKEFTGSTAAFTVNKDNRGIVLEFTGGF